MDYKKLVHIERLIAQTPPPFSDEELDALMTEAAEREARNGIPVTESNPAFAAYLQVYPEADEEYQALVRLLRREFAESQVTQSPSAPLLSLPDPAALPVDQIHASALPAPLPRLRFLPAGVRSAPQRRAGEIISYRPLQVEGLGIEVGLDLAAEGELGTLFLALRQGAAPVAKAQALLYEAPLDAAEAALAADALDQAVSDQEGLIQIGELDTAVAYALLLHLPDGQSLVVEIGAELWRGE